MDTGLIKLMSAAISTRYGFACLLLAIAMMVRAEPPTTREAVDVIITQSRKDPNILLELKNAPLDIIMPSLKRVWIGADVVVDRLQQYQRAGREQEFIAAQKAGGYELEYHIAVLPIVQDILMSDPNFEWTVASRMQRITFDLNERFNRTHYLVDSDFPQELGFVARIPGDTAIRILGSCLGAPNFPDVDLGDSSARSPATWAREILARVVKKRYGEEIPEDVDAARAWWKENEHRFAQKQPPPAIPGTGPGAPQPNNAANPKSPTPLKTSAANPPETNPPTEPTQTPLRWTTGTFLAAALAVVFILIWRARR